MVYMQKGEFPVNLKGRSFLKLLDYTPAEIGALIDLAAAFKAQKKAGVRLTPYHASGRQVEFTL